MSDTFIACATAVAGVYAGVLAFILRTQVNMQTTINALTAQVKTTAGVAEESERRQDLADTRADQTETRADRSEDRETGWSQHRDHKGHS